jgi:hypothetical protein
MCTRGPAIATYDDTLQKPPSRAWRSAPQVGDVLASERSARADVFTVSIVPTDGNVTVTRYSAAVERVQELARTRRVDGWYTCDQTHYARIASYRS